MKKTVFILCIICFFIAFGNLIFTKNAGAQTSIPNVSSPIQSKHSEPNSIRVNVVYKILPSMKETIKNLNGEVINHSEDINMLTVDIPLDNLDQLLISPDVVFIERDKKITAEPEEIVSWDREKVMVPQALSSNLTGKGVNLAVIDTGVLPHKDLVITDGLSFVDYTASYYDDNGHGTHVAGIIAAKHNNLGVIGVAPDVHLYALKVMDQDGSGYISDLVEAIQWSIENRMDIVNISSGSREPSSLLKWIVDLAEQNGILVVAAAGNEGSANPSVDTINYPAKYDSAMAVGAVDQNNNRATFSSTGNALEISAPGVNILSTYINNDYVMMSGTSMATPFIAGIAALLKEANPTYKGDQLRTLLLKASIDLGSPGRDPLYGYGLGQAPYTFIDIYTHWAKNEIIDVYNRGWLVGKGEAIFAPEEVLTRAQAAVIIARMLNLQGTGGTDFTDMNEDFWSYKEIAAVLENGYMFGVGDRKFAPEAPLTREQFAVILDRILVRKDVHNETDRYSLPFTDVKENRWSAGSISRIYELGIIKGTSPNIFSPNLKLTRSQIAAMLSRGSAYLE